MKKYDALLLLGDGVSHDGSLPGSAKAKLEEAARLYHQNVAPHIILSGRWTYKLKNHPTQTEAQAMKSYALSLGVKTSDILAENNSQTTMANIYFTKKLLMKHDWHNVLLVGVEPTAERGLLIAQKLFGSDYTVELAIINFDFPPDALTALAASEKAKRKELTAFFKHFTNGDHEAIYTKANAALQERLKPKA